MQFKKTVLRHGTIVEGKDLSLDEAEAEKVADAVQRNSSVYVGILKESLTSAGFSPKAGRGKHAIFLSDKRNKTSDVVSFPDIHYGFTDDLSINVRLSLTVCRDGGRSKIWLRYILAPVDSGKSIEQIDQLKEFRIHAEELSHEVVSQILPKYYSDIESVLNNTRPDTRKSPARGLTEFGKLVFLASDLPDDTLSDDFLETLEYSGLHRAISNSDFEEIIKPMENLHKNMHKNMQNVRSRDYILHESVDHLSGVFIRSVSDDEARLTGVCLPDKGEYLVSPDGSMELVDNSASESLTRDLSTQYGREF